ncbi:hypothetical protein [Alsobacter sp. R-9]
MSVSSYDDRTLSSSGKISVPIGLVRFVIVLASAAVSLGTFYMLWRGLSLLAG